MFRIKDHETCHRKSGLATYASLNRITDTKVNSMKQYRYIESLENCWEKFSMLLNGQPKNDENSDTAFGKLVGYELGNIEDKNIECNKKRDILKILYDSEQN